jgi:two-component system, LytTR family, response regulator
MLSFLNPLRFDAGDEKVAPPFCKCPYFSTDKTDGVVVKPQGGLTENRRMKKCADRSGAGIFTAPGRTRPIDNPFLALPVLPDGLKSMRVLIVDDEPLARTALENILAARADVESFDSASHAAEALEKLALNSYDVLLLDIDMPGLSGTELVDQLKQPLPTIIFVTAHSQHAIAAFEKHAVDYVLKPFSNQRIAEALTHAFRRTQAERAANLMEALPQLKNLSRSQRPKVAIKIKGKVLIINPADVVAVQAEGNYVLLQRASGSYLLRESISAVAEKLKPYGFIQIHRSVLVNAAFVEEIKPYLTGEYGLRIKGGAEYTVTRTYKKNLKSLADSWIGGSSFFAE